MAFTAKFSFHISIIHDLPEKYNAAAMLGYVVLRLGTGQVDDAHVGEIADYVRKQTKGHVTT